ncbi:AEC family transporter [Pseudomonas sp.]|jgi:malonate transporter|uniref:AEC family transporter n=1 Tax=Pseudomonas sp. TaxID=306 RepID=UPI001A084FDB|nr:AEC family transporter [Pseudomonas sp.]MBF0673915.1 AEC family transporter [Pseudomonas sp.]
MSSVINVILPIFALILIGYVCRKTNRLGPHAASEINRFVVWLALPALLFSVTANSSWESLWQPGFLLAFGGGSLAVFILTLLYRLKRSAPLADANIDGLSAAYANTGYVGIPLCILVFGEGGLEPALVATLVVVCGLFAIAVVGIEVALQGEKSLGAAVRKVSLALLKNPLVISPILGALWAAGGQPLPQALAELLRLLGAATTPCALVSLGLFLAHEQRGDSEGSLALTGMKLIIQPLITWYVAFQLLELPSLWAHAALLLSALPTGTGPYMLAEYYQRTATRVSRAVLYSTLGSLVTLSLCLYWLGY